MIRAFFVAKLHEGQTTGSACRTKDHTLGRIFRMTPSA